MSISEFLATFDQWLSVIVGVLLLALGRKLFWLLLATLGFLFAFTLVPRLADDSPSQLVWVLSVGLGIVAGIAAVFLQRIAVAVAGFLFGGYGVLWLLDHYAVELGGMEWVVLGLGAVAGAALALMVLEEALIVLSSILGAMLLVSVLGLGGLPALALLLVLVIVGVTIQSRSQRKARS